MIIIHSFTLEFIYMHHPIKPALNKEIYFISTFSFECAYKLIVIFSNFYPVYEIVRLNTLS